MTLPRRAQDQDDMSHITLGCPADQWQVLIDTLRSGATVEIHQLVMAYFLSVLPPHWGGYYQGHWAFVFCEGLDLPQLFWTAQGRCFTRCYPDWPTIRREVHTLIYHQDYPNL